MTRSSPWAVAASITLPEASGGSLRKQLRLDYTLSPQVEGLSFFGLLDTVLSGTPQIPGSTEMTYTVTDANGVSDSQTFTINVANGPTAPTAAPASLEAAQETSGPDPNGSSASATWDAVPGATGYVVQVIEAGGSFPDKPLNAAPAGVALKIVSDVLPERVFISAISTGDYKVRVAARNGDGVGPWSAEVSFTVSPPTQRQQRQVVGQQEQQHSEPGQEQQQGGSEGDPCDPCGTGGELGVVVQGAVAVRRPHRQDVRVAQRPAVEQLQGAHRPLGPGPAGLRRDGGRHVADGHDRGGGPGLRR